MRIIISILLLAMVLESRAATNYPATPVTWNTIRTAVLNASTGGSVWVTNAILTISATNTLLMTNAVNLLWFGTAHVTNDVLGLNEPLINIDTTYLNDRVTLLDGRGGLNIHRGSAAAQFSGCVQLNGINTNHHYVRATGIRWHDLATHPFYIYGAIGLVDNQWTSLTGSVQFARVWHQNFNGGTYGNGSWAEDPDYNGTNWIFFESNTVFRAGTPYPCIDGEAGARWVFRFNITTNCPLDSHGTESGQDYRSARAVQEYGNRLHFTAAYDSAKNYRGGSGIFCSNVLSGTQVNAMLHLSYYRLFAMFIPWGMAAGTNDWDTNWPGGPFLTVQHNGGNNSSTFINTSSNWTENLWQGYSIISTSNFSTVSTTKPRGSLILSNTATTIYYQANENLVSDTLLWTNNQWGLIWRVDEGIDQPGKGSGDLLTTAASFETPRNLAQVDEPIHYHNNDFFGGGEGTVSVGQPFQIRAGEHYTNAIKTGWVPMGPHWLYAASEGSPPPAGDGPTGTKSPPLNKRIKTRR